MNSLELIKQLDVHEFGIDSEAAPFNNDYEKSAWAVGFKDGFKFAIREILRIIEEEEGKP